MSRSGDFLLLLLLTTTTTESITLPLAYARGVIRYSIHRDRGHVRPLWSVPLLWRQPLMKVFEGLQRSNIFRIYVSFAWFVLSSSGLWVWRMVVIQLAAPSQRSWVMLASFLGPLFFNEKCACAVKRYGKGSLIYRSWLFQLPSTH